MTVAIDVERSDATASIPVSRSWPARLWRGPAEDPPWARPALIGLLGTTLLLYAWQLGDSGWANAYYTAAVQAGTRSWKAFFFGSVDASNFITVDKTPLALWPMVLSARVFGVNAWSVLVPQAIEGVLAVALLHATLRRWFDPIYALLGATVMAFTPAAALMFRFNSPDALLVCLLVLGAYSMTRAIEDGRTRWLVLGGAAIGLAFLAKELQAFLVLPGFGVAYLLAGPPKLGRRIVQLVWCGVATIVAGGWWVAIVSLWPADSRPYIGGSQNNSFWNVLFGYNGFGRLTGNETGSVGGSAQPGPGMGPTGWTRLFNDSFGGQASWLLPAALALLVATAAITFRAPRTDRTRAALVLWGGWLLVTGTAFSLGEGIIHEYYTVALAPAIGAMVAIGCATLWPRHHIWFARVALTSTVALSTWWARELLHRSPDWHPWLRPALTIAGLVVIVLLLIGPKRRLALIVGMVAVLVGIASPAASSVTTAATPHTGPILFAGPASTGQSLFGPGSGRPPAGFPFGPGGFPGSAPTNPPGGLPDGSSAGLPDGFPGGLGGGAPNDFPGAFPGGPFVGGNASQVARGGGPFATTEPPDDVVELLQQDAQQYRWVAAGIGATSTAAYQLASGQPLMAIGGFNGTDPTPTLGEFREYVRNGEVHYFIGGAGPFGFARGNGPDSGGSTARISAWVADTFEPVTVGGVTLYDLTAPLD